MTLARIPIPQEQIAEFCRKHHIRKLSLFGSVIRDDFRPESDVDVLVEFEPGTVVRWGIVSIEAELSAILGRKADLQTEGGLSKYFRDEVIREAEPQYVAQV